MSWQSETRAWTLAAAGVFCLCSVAYKVLTIPNLKSVTDGATQTFALINRPEGAKDVRGKLLPPGSIAVFNKAVTKAGDATVTGQLSLQQIAPAIQATASSFQTIVPHANEALDGVSQTAQTASRSLQDVSDHLTPVLDSTNATVKALGDAVTLHSAALEVSERDFDALVTNPAVAQTEDNIQQITKEMVPVIATGNHMLSTADQVETKLTKCTLNPTFWCSFKSDVIFGAQVGGYLLH